MILSLSLLILFFEPKLFGLGIHQGKCRLTFVWNHSVEY